MKSAPGYTPDVPVARCTRKGEMRHDLVVSGWACLAPKSQHTSRSLKALGHGLQFPAIWTTKSDESDEHYAPCSIYIQMIQGRFRKTLDEGLESPGEGSKPSVSCTEDFRRCPPRNDHETRCLMTHEAGDKDE